MMEVSLRILIAGALVCLDEKQRLFGDVKADETLQRSLICP